MEPCDDGLLATPLTQLWCCNAQAKKSELKTKACQLMGLDEQDVRMWDYYMDNLYANLEEQLDDSVEGPVNILNDKQAILLEEKVHLLQLYHPHDTAHAFHRVTPIHLYYHPQLLPMHFIASHFIASHLYTCITTLNYCPCISSCHICTPLSI